MDKLDIHAVAMLLGQMGGNKTKANHEPDYYKKISKLAHASKKRIAEARKIIRKEQEKF